MAWFVLSILALAGFGAQNFLYKISAVRELRTRTVTFYFVLLSTLVVWLAFLLQAQPSKFNRAVFIYGAIDAVSFYATTLCRIEALKFIPSHLVFPLLRISTIIVAVVGVYVFGDAFSVQLALGLLLMLATAVLIGSERKADKAVSPNYRLGLLLTLFAALTSASAHVVSKVAADNTQLLDYMAVANTIVLLFSLIETRVATGLHIGRPTRLEFWLASGLAVFNLLAWYCYLCALRLGPLSSAALIVSLAFVIPIVLSAIVYREHLTPRRILAVIISVAIVLLLKMN